MSSQNWNRVGLTESKTGRRVSLARYIKSKRYMLPVGAALMLFVQPVTVHAAQAGGLGTGRLLPTLAAVVGLIGVIVGRRALARSRNGGSGRNGGTVALISGLISLVVGGLHAANAAGSFGTGNGLAGAIVALVLGLAALIIGIMAVARSRRESVSRQA